MRMRRIDRQASNHLITRSLIHEPQTSRDLMPTARSKSLHEAVNSRVSERLWAHSRLLVALIVGVLVAVFVPLDGAMTRILAAWNAAGWLYIALLGVMMFRCEIDGIRQKLAWKRKAGARSLF